jgi:hypothetical protein
MAMLRGLFTNLRLHVNEGKSAVARPEERKFLGYTFQIDSEGTVHPIVAKPSIDRFKDRVRAATCRVVGRSISQVVAELRSFIPGWKHYFRLANTPRTFHSIDGWIRRRLRALQFKQWKNAKTIVRELRARRVPGQFVLAAAKHAGRWWRMARHTALQTALPSIYFDAIGLPRLDAGLTHRFAWRRPATPATARPGASWSVWSWIVTRRRPRRSYAKGWAARSSSDDRSCNAECARVNNNRLDWFSARSRAAVAACLKTVP